MLLLRSAAPLIHASAQLIRHCVMNAVRNCHVNIGGIYAVFYNRVRTFGPLPIHVLLGAKTPVPAPGLAHAPDLDLD